MYIHCTSANSKTGRISGGTRKPSPTRLRRCGTSRGGWSGGWRPSASRSGQERVHFQAPPADRIGQEMDAFLAWFNRDTGLDPVLKAGLAHLWFVTVHPFDDGNGRIARAIADMAMARSEGTPHRFYSMSAQIRLERNAY